MGKEKVVHIDLEDSVSTKRLTRRESFPEEILAACFALAWRHHGTGCALHLQARALALHGARHLLRVQHLVFGLRELCEQLCERVPGELLRGKQTNKKQFIYLFLL